MLRAIAAPHFALGDLPQSCLDCRRTHEGQLSSLIMDLLREAEVFTRKNAGLAFLAVSTFEHKELIWHLVLKIIPSLCIAVVDLYVLAKAP